MGEYRKLIKNISTYKIKIKIIIKVRVVSDIY